MSAVSSTMCAHDCMHSLKSAISLSLMVCAFQPGSLLIVRVRNSVRPIHLFDHNRDHDYYFELPNKGSGMPNHYAGDLLHTMATSGLSRVSIRACGPRNFMKITQSRRQNGRGFGAARLISQWRS